MFWLLRWSQKLWRRDTGGNWPKNWMYAGCCLTSLWDTCGMLTLLDTSQLSETSFLLHKEKWLLKNSWNRFAAIYMYFFNIFRTFRICSYQSSELASRMGLKWCNLWFRNIFKLRTHLVTCCLFYRSVRCGGAMSWSLWTIRTSADWSGAGMTSSPKWKNTLTALLQWSCPRTTR